MKPNKPDKQDSVNRKIIFDEKTESMILDGETLSWLFDQLHSIIEPEVFYNPDSAKTAEDALSRCRLRARDIVARLADALPIEHGLMESAGDSLTVLDLYKFEPAINRDWPGRDSNNYRPKPNKQSIKRGGRNG